LSTDFYLEYFKILNSINQEEEKADEGGKQQEGPSNRQNRNQKLSNLLYENTDEPRFDTPGSDGVRQHNNNSPIKKPESTLENNNHAMPK